MQQSKQMALHTTIPIVSSFSVTVYSCEQRKCCHLLLLPEHGYFSIILCTRVLIFSHDSVLVQNHPLTA